VFCGALEQRCWVHKTANVLDALPKRLQPRAKSLLHEMAEAPTRADARNALERFRDEFDAKYPKAVAKLDKDWEQLTAFYSFPAEHWRHLRTTNPIESSFATVKLRTKVTKGAGSKKAALAMAYKLLDAAQERWRPRARRRRTRRHHIQGRDQGHRRRNHDEREGRRLIILHCRIHNI
jgi:putative transposase